MKIPLLLSLMLLFSGPTQADDCGTPPPGTQFSPCPSGACEVEAFAQTSVYTVTEPTTITLVNSTGGLADYAVLLQFNEKAGCEYEIQFCRSLSAPIQWIAYARWTAEKDDLISTYCYVFQCGQARFFRTMLKPPPAPIMRRITPQIHELARHHYHNSLHRIDTPRVP